MARLALIWLTVVVAVNCKLLLKEDAREPKVNKVDAYEAPSLLHKGDNKPVKARETPTEIPVPGAVSETGQICSGCGVANITTDRYVGGQPVVWHEADENEYPWMILMVVDSDGMIYGASLIAPSWILTAQKCVYGAKAADIRVAYGIHKDTDSFTDWITADEIISHPDYIYLSLQNDIALVHLETPVPLGDGVVPVCLPTGLTTMGEVAVVSAWGGDQSSDIWEFPDNLQEVEVDISRNSECNFYDYEINITDAMVCAVREGFELRFGGSGGAMVVQNGHGTWDQVGIVISGNEIEQNSIASVFTRVHYFYSWITSVVTTCG